MAEAKDAEVSLLRAGLILIRESPVRPAYDLPHLCAIHQSIFGDIYEWAGQIQTVAMAKGNLFCLPQYIESSSAGIFRALHSENFLQGLERRPFIDRLTYLARSTRFIRFVRATGGPSGPSSSSSPARLGTRSPGSTLTLPATSSHPQRSCAATWSPCGRCSTRS